MQKENILFAEEEKIREGRGGKYLDQENMFFCGRSGREGQDENIWTPSLP